MSECDGGCAQSGSVILSSGIHLGYLDVLIVRSEEDCVGAPEGVPPHLSGESQQQQRGQDRANLLYSFSYSTVRVTLVVWVIYPLTAVTVTVEL